MSRRPKRSLHRGGDAIDLVEPAQIAGDDEDFGVRPRPDLLRRLRRAAACRARRSQPARLRRRGRARWPGRFPASSRHQRRLAGQFEIHEVSLSRDVARSRRPGGKRRAPRASRSGRPARPIARPRARTVRASSPSSRRPCSRARPSVEQRPRARRDCRWPGAGSRPPPGSGPAAPRDRLAARVAPGGLQQLVDLEVEVRVEERRRRVEDVGARVAGGRSPARRARRSALAARSRTRRA